jgi:hypothetical protein
MRKTLTWTINQANRNRYTGRCPPRTSRSGFCWPRDRRLELMSSASYSVTIRLSVSRNPSQGEASVSRIGIHPPRNRTCDSWDFPRRMVTCAAGKVEFPADTRTSSAVVHRHYQGPAADPGNRPTQARKPGSQSTLEVHLRVGARPVPIRSRSPSTHGAAARDGR